MQIAIFSKAAN